MPAAGAQGAVDGGDNAGQVGPCGMEQAGIGPHRVILRDRVQLVEAHLPRADIEAFVRLAHHCGGAIGRVEIETAFDDPRRIAPSAAAEL